MPLPIHGVLGWYFPGLQMKNCFQSTKRCSVRPSRVSMTGENNIQILTSGENLGEKIKFQTIDLSPGLLSSKPSKLNKDFAELRWWRTSSAPLLPPLLLLSTGSLGCTTSCFLAERGKCKGNIVCYWGNSLERVFTTFN